MTDQLQEKPMNAPTSAASAEKMIESEMAEEICKSLEQTILKYFPQIDRPRSSSVPLVPQRQE
jgi:hypothetical protein